MLYVILLIVFVRWGTRKSKSVFVEDLKGMVKYIFYIPEVCVIDAFVFYDRQSTLGLQPKDGC